MKKISKKSRDTATLKERSLSISVLVIQKPHFLNSFICGGIQIQIQILRTETIRMTVCAWLYSTAGDVLVRKNVGMVSATVDFKPLCYISFANLNIRYITKIYSIVSKSPNIWLGLSRTHVKYFKNNALGQIILEEFNWWWFIIGIKPFDIITSSNS